MRLCLNFLFKLKNNALSSYFNLNIFKCENKKQIKDNIINIIIDLIDKNTTGNRLYNISSWNNIKTLGNFVEQNSMNNFVNSKIVAKNFINMYPEVYSDTEFDQPF